MESSIKNQKKSIMYLAKLSEIFQSKKVECFFIKEKADDFSILIFESSVKLEKLLLDLDAKQLLDMQSVHANLGNILHPLITMTIELFSMYRELGGLYQELTNSIQNSKSILTGNTTITNSENQQNNSETPQWLLGFCIRNTLPLFDSNIESSLVEFKKRASCISTEVLNISRSSLSRVKQWISTIIHDLEMLECNIENHFQDVFGDLES